MIKSTGLELKNWRQLILTTALLCLTACGDVAKQAPQQIDSQMLELRDRGLAELENERPDQAETIFRQLSALVNNDPLPNFNLAIAMLRQQKLADAQTLLAPLMQNSPPARVLALQAEIHQQQGDQGSAIKYLQQALDAAPQDSEVAYAAYNLASQVRSEGAQVLATSALEKLGQLRPDNPWLALKRLQQALLNNDRTTAASSYLRLTELSWQFNSDAKSSLQALGESIDSAQIDGQHGNAIRLENLLRASELYRESLRELRIGILGVPIDRFNNESASHIPFAPTAVVFSAEQIGAERSQFAEIVSGDIDNDGHTDIVHLLNSESNGKPGNRLEIRLAASKFSISQEIAITETTVSNAAKLLLNDVDNDDKLDLLVFLDHGTLAWRGRGDGSFAVAPDNWGFSQISSQVATALDFDMEGDLDIALFDRSKQKLELMRNNLVDSLQPIGASAFAAVTTPITQARYIVASDLDRDEDMDLLLMHNAGLSWLDNQRFGEFGDRSEVALLSNIKAMDALLAADMNNDGMPDIVLAAANSIQILINRDGTFPNNERIEFRTQSSSASALVVADFNNDGNKDLAVGSNQGVELFLQSAQLQFAPILLESAPQAVHALNAADFNGDGKIDLIASSASGLTLLQNQTQTANGWLSVRLKGLNSGSSKINSYAVGASIEVRNGEFYQRFEVNQDTTHIGLGTQQQADVLRVLWTNGVPQNRIALAGNQHIVEEQVLKGSCPFLYAWNGERFEFVSDLLWGAPLGLPVAPGVWLPADPSELVRVDGLVARNGKYDLRITEELWEAAFFDHLKLWVVDHPSNVEVASNLRIVPGQFLDEKVHASRQIDALALALDGQNIDVTEKVAWRDEVYADGYLPGPYQGFSISPWTFTMDLGRSPNKPIRLLLEGWIFPADASLNLAVAQRPDIPYLAPRIEVETANGWQTLLENAGFPAGKTKVMVIDLPALPKGSRKLRIVTNLWLHWDRIRWTEAADDAAHIVQAQLLPIYADLHARGYSRLLRRASNAPHSYDYEQVDQTAPWLPFRGHYTRYGDVLPLLTQADDLSVILAAGDELSMSFDASGLPALANGMQRTLFLESHGWDKDADLNTFEAQQVEPLPFRAMSGYPWKADEHYPDSPAHREYQANWLTREIK